MDTLIGTVSQVALNHIGLLIIDEIQNVVNKNGKAIIGTLTQLINNSGLSIVKILDAVAKRIRNSMTGITRKIVDTLQNPELRKQNLEPIRNQAKKSILICLCYISSEC